VYDVRVSIYMEDRPTFGSKMGFLGLADRMALFLFGANSIGTWEKTMREE